MTTTEDKKIFIKSGNKRQKVDISGDVEDKDIQQGMEMKYVDKIATSSIDVSSNEHTTTTSTMPTRWTNDAEILSDGNNRGI